MGFIKIVSTTIFIVLLPYTIFGAPKLMKFEKCNSKGFLCQNSQHYSNKKDVIFECNSTTGQDVKLYLWSFNAPSMISTLSIQNCDKLELSVTCSKEDRQIKWLKVINITNLVLTRPAVARLPPKVTFENISNIDIIPQNVFTQITNTAYKPGCSNPIEDLDTIYFSNVTINMVEPGAFGNLTNMKYFTWNNVTANRIAYGAINLRLLEDGHGLFRNVTVEVLEPMALQIIGDSLYVMEGSFGVLSASSINGTVYNFEFKNNTVNNTHSGAIAMLAQNVYIKNNYFKNVESGAFQKISPGLVRVSQRNFGKLIFVYEFDNNTIGHTEDGGVRPDIEAYKNVAAEISYTNNSMQCSCETLSWFGADIDLGYGYSVLKDFNSIVLDSKNNNTCQYMPCMCFGINPTTSKGTKRILFS